MKKMVKKSVRRKNKKMRNTRKRGGVIIDNSQSERIKLMESHSNLLEEYFNLQKELLKKYRNGEKDTLSLEQKMIVLDKQMDELKIKIRGLLPK